MPYDAKTAIEDMVRATTDPIIVMDEGWGDTIPTWVREHIRTQRMIQVLEASKNDRRPEEATDAEALAYLYTASFLAHMPYEWAQIYLWLGREVMKVMPSAKTGEIPFAPKELGPDEKRDLEGLKQWLWERRLKARKRR